MNQELTVLALAALLQVLQFVLYAVPANIELGMGYTNSARDREPSRALSDKTARLGRAMDNHFEGLILFTIAVLVVTLGNAGTGFTAACAWAYLAARIAYIPAYYYGLRPGRSLVWIIGFLATVLMLLVVLV